MHGRGGPDDERGSDRPPEESAGRQDAIVYRDREELSHLDTGVAASLGAPGLFLVAALDSSFLSLPQVNDLLLILSVTRHPEWMPLYASMSTLGSLAGCFVMYAHRPQGRATR